ncbi:MAG: HpcH/HpaI aldolase/citrate lyase family protein [Pseudomonadota bacterium]
MTAFENAPTNTLKARLAHGHCQTGVWVASASPVIAELAGTIGFDWCLIDGEHGPNGLSDIRAQLQALAATSTPAVVRVPTNKDWIIKQALDAGAQTILVPLVDTPDQALVATRACRYPPAGNRGMGGALARATNFNQRTNYVATANDQICCIVQAETQSALDNLDAIAATDGVDGVFIGPADLSADMGYPGDPNHPKVLETIDAAIDVIRASGKIAGIVTFDPQQVDHYRKKRVGFLGVGADVTALRGALEALKAL